MKPYSKLKSRKKVVDKKKMISEMHDSEIKRIQDYYATLPQVKKNLENVKNEYEQYLTLDYRKRYETRRDDMYFKEKIESLEKEIHNIENQTELFDYLSNVQHVIYKIHEETTNDNCSDDSTMTPTLKDKINEGIKKYIKITQSINRETLLEEYISAMNGVTDMFSNKKPSQDFFNCSNCKEPMESHPAKSLLVCCSCGLTKDWQDPDMPQWSDEVDFSKTYRYKKLGYFIEHLYRMEARECTTIPETVINNVLMKLREKRIKSNENIEKKVIKGILKELDMTNYYDNINSILRTISGKEAPKFPEDLEDKLICMFMRTLEPFEKYKSIIPSRNNYLSYPYAIRKLLEIISREENDPSILKFKEYFGLLKSRDKTWEHERVWKNICRDNNWPFIPSI